MKIKVLSLWEPYASAMRYGFKANETRGWYLSYRGLLGIHAARKKFNPDEYSPEFVMQVVRDGLMPRLAYGSLVAIVDVWACVRTAQVRDQISGQERIYGDYRDKGDDGKDRYAIRTRNLRPLPRSIPLTGHQGPFDWDVPDELVDALHLRDAVAEDDLFSGASNGEGARQ
jgi:hypothetical protein